jgi:hypothetical protein
MKFQGLCYQYEQRIGILENQRENEKNNRQAGHRSCKCDILNEK